MWTMASKFVPVALLLAGTAIVCFVPAPRAAGAPYQVLVFSKTAGFRHDTQIALGQAAITDLAAANGFTPTFTEDAADFTNDNLTNFRAVVFLNTTGDVLNATQQAAFEDYIRAGGGFVGTHSATDTEYDWPWYGGLVGAYFADHPPGLFDAALDVVDPSHPSTAHLPPRFTVTDEWYNFQTDPTPSVHVLLNLDESTYTGGTMGPSHPIAWFHSYDGGRAWYSGLGHNEDIYTQSWYRQHLLGGIEYAANVPETNARSLAALSAIVIAARVVTGRRNFSCRRDVSLAGIPVRCIRSCKSTAPRLSR
jgi:type 1 glutamine amidotransferase